MKVCWLTLCHVRVSRGAPVCFLPRLNCPCLCACVGKCVCLRNHSRPRYVGQASAITRLVRGEFITRFGWWWRWCPAATKGDQRHSNGMESISHCRSCHVNLYAFMLSREWHMHDHVLHFQTRAASWLCMKNIYSAFSFQLLNGKLI